MEPEDEANKKQFPIEPKFQEAMDRLPPEQYGHATAHLWVAGRKKQERQRFAET